LRTCRERRRCGTALTRSWSAATPLAFATPRSTVAITVTVALTVAVALTGWRPPSLPLAVSFAFALSTRIAKRANGRDNFSFL